MDLLGGIWAAFNDPILDGPGETITHVWMSLVALAIATAVGVALGIVSSKAGRIAGFAVITAGNLGRTAPTFGIMALAVAIASTGFWPAVAGLTLLGIPPILLNTYTGVRGAEAGTVEAARGMGLNRRQILTGVELPSAVPLIFTGIRVSAVQIVATASLAGLVGADGLGVLVLAGLSNNQTDVLLAGAIPIALLAVATEIVFSSLSHVLTPKGLRLARRPAHD